MYKKMEYIGSKRPIFIPNSIFLKYIIEIYIWL